MLIFAQLVIKMKKIIFILIMLSIILCVGSNVKAASNEIWINLTYENSYKLYSEYTTSGDYGEITLKLANYKLNDNYNKNSNYNYYAVSMEAQMSLYEQYQHEENKLFGGIKFLWLNAGIEFRCYIDGYDEGDLELVSYSPQTKFFNGTYNSIDDLNNGNFSYQVENAMYDSFISNEYSTNGKSLIDISSYIDDIVDINYIYNGYKINDALAGDYLMGYTDIYDVLKSLSTNSVKHSDNYQTFQQTMTDGVSFIYRRPKSHTGGFPLCVFCYGTQLYIDYDWRNSHNFDEMMVMTGMMSIA